MGVKRLTISLVLLLTLIFSGAAESQKVKISGKVTSPDSKVKSVKVICLIYNQNDVQIDIKKKILKGGGQYSFEVPEDCRIILDASSFTRDNRAFRAMTPKITIGTEDISMIDLVLKLQEPDRYKGEEITISGKIKSPRYKGPIDITIVTEEDNEKAIENMSHPVVTAKTTVKTRGGSIEFSIKAPKNLGPSFIFVAARGIAGPPVGQEINIGSSDITNINLETFEGF